MESFYNSLKEEGRNYILVNYLIIKGIKMDKMNNITEVTDSMFHMWRAVFAMAHADHVVTPEELSFMRKIMAEMPFTEEQLKILENDISNPKWVGEMFDKITNDDDRSKFFYYARLMVWSDGDFDAQEQAIISELQKKYVKDIDLKNVTNVIGLELEEDEKEQLVRDYTYAEEMEPEGGLRAFFRRFFVGR